MNALGALHLASAGVAMIAGGVILAKPKGTLFHKRAGYLYTYTMAYMNLSALLIYNLNGFWNGFHVGALMSFATIVVGLFALYVSRSPRAVNIHLSMMFWSVVGLYAAFFSELLTRVSSLPFVTAVLVPTFIVTITGAILFGTWARKWFRKT